MPRSLVPDEFRSTEVHQGQLPCLHFGTALFHFKCCFVSASWDLVKLHDVVPSFSRRPEHCYLFNYRRM